MIAISRSLTGKPSLYIRPDKKTVWSNQQTTQANGKRKGEIITNGHRK